MNINVLKVLILPKPLFGAYILTKTTKWPLISTLTANNHPGSIYFFNLGGWRENNCNSCTQDFPTTKNTLIAKPHSPVNFIVHITMSLLAQKSYLNFFNLIICVIVPAFLSSLIPLTFRDPTCNLSIREKYKRKQTRKRILTIVTS